MTAPALPDPDADLLARLRVGDTVAPAELAVAHMDGLVVYLRQRYPSAHEHFLFEAAGDAVLALIKNPGAFDPARNTLAGYLRMAALGDLHNLFHKEGRHHRDRAGPDSVELVPDDRNEGMDEPDGPSFDAPELAAVIARLNEIERRFFDLIRSGENRTAVLAPVLGLGDRPEAEQQAEVKKMRDRLIKRFQRAKEQS
ncbi:MAG TPA: hypothetical protein VH092_03370 [Urbifossiella sp.]|jgi:hypothetical protein|nr:hypothetical protein [Urbifossiella sp.]